MPYSELDSSTHRPFMSWKGMEISSDENNSLVTDTSEPSIQEKPLKNKFKRNNSCRRFTDEQIKSLESIFSLETKLEPRKKQQVAKDLGLEPRQVAIWFQNRRARGKSKQIEREYKVLRANYDSLHMKLDELRRENSSLEMQLKELNDALENQDKVSLVNTDLEAKDYTTNSNEGYQNSKYRYIGTPDEKEEDEVVGWGEEEEEEDISVLRSDTNTTTWLDMSCDGPFDKSFCGSNWWET